MHIEFVQKFIDKIRGKKFKPHQFEDAKKYLINKEYGKIYFPAYNLNFKISNKIPDIYNKDGQKMDMFFIRDIHSANSPYGFSSKYFMWDRYNIGLDTHFYTHNSMLESMGKPVNKYGLMIESKSIVPNDYLIFDKNKGLEKDFDAIFTYDEKLLNQLDNAKFLPICAQTWYDKEFGGGFLSSEAYKAKTKNISIVSSNKRMCHLHDLRIELAIKCKKNNLADTFGTFDNRKPSKIADSLADYRYSIVIENDVTDYFFTEKITNCFVSMTIPIYIGARKIDEYFNSDGIIKISEADFDNIDKVLSKCTKDEYENRLEAVKDNYKRALRYCNMDDYLYETYFMNK